MDADTSVSRTCSGLVSSQHQPVICPGFGRGLLLPNLTYVYGNRLFSLDKEYLRNAVAFVAGEAGR